MLVEHTYIFCLCPFYDTHIYYTYSRIIRQFLLNFNNKALGVGLYARLPNSHTLTATVSMAWTISRPVGLPYGMCMCGSESGEWWDHTQTAAAAAAAYQLIHPLYLDTTPTLTPHKGIIQPSHTQAVRWNCHVHVGCNHCRELIHTHTLSMHRSGLLVRRRFWLPAYMRVTIFCHFLAAGMKVGLYASISPRRPRNARTKV